MSNVAEADKMVELLREHIGSLEKIRIQAEWLKRNSTLPVVRTACHDVEYYIASIQDLGQLGGLEDVIHIIEENKEP